MQQKDREEQFMTWKSTLSQAVAGKPQHMILLDMSGSVCGHCDSRDHLKHCNGCFKIFYCSKTCQQAHWHEHKINCRGSIGSVLKTTMKAGQAVWEGTVNDFDDMGSADDSSNNKREKLVLSSSESPSAFDAVEVTKKQNLNKDVGVLDELYLESKGQNEGRSSLKEENKIQNEAGKDQDKEVKNKSFHMIGQGVQIIDQDILSSTQIRNQDAGCQDQGVKGKNRDFQEIKCKKCKTIGRSMKRCGQCWQVVYCSKDCQRNDWASHKKFCKKFTRSKGARCQAAYSVKENEWEAGKMFEEFAEMLSRQRPKSSEQKPQLSWAQAKVKAMQHYPDKKIITEFLYVPTEHELVASEVTSSILLVRLSRPHPYIFRHGWYLEDTRGIEKRVFFYLNDDSPEPWFSWSQLNLGIFMCLEHAYIHTFLDGTTGFRVDDGCDIFIISD